MNFKQLEKEHDAQAWERMKLMIKLSNSWFKFMDDYTKFLCGTKLYF